MKWQSRHYAAMCRVCFQGSSLPGYKASVPCQLLAEASFSHCMDLSTGLFEGPHDISTGFPIASDKSESGSHNGFYDLALKLTLSLLS